VVIPESLTYLKAASISPPLQPKLPYDFEQSTNCCSERETSFPVAIAFIPSKDPVDEKAQHDPHDPWFLIGVTAFLSLQSTESAAVS